MRWEDYLQITRGLQLRDEEAAGALIAYGLQAAGSDSTLDDPFDAEITAVQVPDLLRAWKGYCANPLPHFSVRCTNYAHLDDLTAMFTALSHELPAWTIPLPDTGNPFELLWPLRIGVAGSDGEAVRQHLVTHVNSQMWLRPLLFVSREPAGEGGHLDIAIFPDAASALETLYSSILPIQATTLLLLSGPAQDITSLQNDLPELISLTHAHAVIVADKALLQAGAGWVPRFAAEISHDSPWDTAAWQGVRYSGVQPKRFAVFATPRFLEQARLSGKTELILRRIAQTKPVEEAMHGLEGVYSHGGGGAGWNWDAVESQLRRPVFQHESDTATTIAEAAQQVPDPPAPVAERFLQARVSGTAEADPLETLEAGKEYVVCIRIGAGDGWTTSREALPEPPLKPQETAVPLTVVFREAHSCPKALLQTIQLPRAGTSTTAQFRVNVSAESNVFDGRITIFHNNRPLMGCAYRLPVKGAPDDAVLERPEMETLFRTRRFDAGLDNHQPAAATLSVVGEEVTVVSGQGKPVQISLGGVKEALARMEKAINGIALEEIDRARVVASKDAARLLVQLARQGYYLHEALYPPLKKALATPRLFTVLASETSIRVPFELCYSFDEPKKDAVLCPDSLRAVSHGRCIESCAGSQDREGHVCPMGFWGMQRAIEWRTFETDPPDGDPVAPAPDRERLAPLREVLYAHSANVTDTTSLEDALEQLSVASSCAQTWDDWAKLVKQHSPSLLLLMPHVDRQVSPPEMEISGERKDPPGVKQKDVAMGDGERPVVLLFGCGAATFSVSYQNFPSQFRQCKAAVVVAPIAEILAADAPELAAAFLNIFGVADDLPVAEAVLRAKRAAVASGVLSGLLLLSFGDADWKVSA